MADPEATDDDVVSLFFPETDAGRAAGNAHIARISTRRATGRPGVSDEAATGQLAAIGRSAAVPFDQVRANLESIGHPVLYATGMQDAMIPALASYVAVQHLANATLVAYGDAGHGFPFQHIRPFVAQVTDFLAG
jgi:pimeloyl-ACP methyl ester carboxylesterase